MTMETVEMAMKWVAFGLGAISLGGISMFLAVVLLEILRRK
jgi:hypothetical protein